MKQLLIVVFVNIFIVINEAQSVITATSTSTDIENYINSEYDTATGNTDYFRDDTINCGASTCNIVCDVNSGCYGTTINADSATTLNIKCNEYQSCKNSNINANSTTRINIECSQYEACSSMEVYADQTQHIDIKCNYNATTSYSYGSCEYIRLYAIHSGTTNVFCESQNCYRSKFYLSNAMTASIDNHGYYAMYDAYIYAENMQNGLNVICNGSRACYYSDFYTTSMSSDLFVSCYDDDGCFYTHLYGGTMSGNVNIKCQGDPNENDTPCYNIIAFMSDITGILTVDCMEQYNCQHANIYCHKGCNINCLTPYSCENTNIYIDTHFDYDINLNCSNISTSCENAEIHCQDTGGLTTLIYDDATSKWECSIHACCPFANATITCDVGVPCMVDCAGGKCEGAHINGSMAISLDLNCTGFRECEGTKIDCPTGSNVSCFINCYDPYGCYYAQVTTGIDNTMHEFALNCGPNGCQFMDIAINSSTINNINIDCAISACFKTVLFTKANINNVDIQCPKQYSCQNLELYFLGTMTNKTTLNCGEYRSCWLGQFRGITDKFSMNCSGEGSCRSINIDYTINNDQFVLDCITKENCEVANIKIISTKINANIGINCMNPSISTGGSVGACNAGYFYIYGYVDNDVKTNNVTIQCSQYDCDNTKFYVYNTYYVDVRCNDPYSCRSVYLEADTSKYLHLDCNESYSCNGGTVYCPYQNISVCDIDCKSRSNACSFMNIYVSDSFVYDYLDLKCDAIELNGMDSVNTCNSLEVNCVSRTDITYIYNDIANDYKCEYHGSSYCCPYTIPITSSPSMAPSKSTTTSPSSFPSKIPSSSPSKAPSKVPTKAPITSSPSSSPSTSPSYPSKPPTLSLSPSLSPSLSSSLSSSPSYGPSKDPSSSPTTPRSNTRSPTRPPSVAPIATVIATEVGGDANVMNVMSTCIFVFVCCVCLF